ncbi:hypothetical protein PLICRDRAFT_108915 [Plicaturopsis crispa FD-325 SS-3]|nr:hypothetical protein PLICRDRAFT_108915 [Plicaturopsis crispa FD-325 SS-3]
MSGNSNNVGIFWDYENVGQGASQSSGFAIANRIRSLAYAYGRVTLFKAYLELQVSTTSSKAATFRSELQCSGVSLTDCPHNNRKEVADNMMIVDMLAYAVENPAPATLILITGDRDFAYAVSVLRMMRYTVVLILPQNRVHESLTAQASRSYLWSRDILETTAEKAITQTPTPADTSCGSNQSHYNLRSKSKQSLASGSSLVETTPSVSQISCVPAVKSTHVQPHHPMPSAPAATLRYSTEDATGVPVAPAACTP